MPQRTSIQKKSFEAYIPSNQTYIYHSLKEFCDRVSKLKSLDDWNVTLLFDRTLIQFFTKPITLPQFEIIAHDSLGFTVSLYGWLLPETDLLYYDYRRSIRNVNITELVTKIKSYFICKGVSCTYNTNNKIIRHSVPKLHDPLLNEALLFGFYQNHQPPTNRPPTHRPTDHLPTDPPTNYY